MEGNSFRKVSSQYQAMTIPELYIKVVAVLEQCFVFEHCSVLVEKIMGNFSTQLVNCKRVIRFSPKLISND